jgi:hypothetical protein
MVYVPKLTKCRHSQQQEKCCSKDENRKQEKFTVQDVSEKGRKKGSGA